MTDHDFTESVRKHLRSRSLDSWEWYGETREIFQINVNPKKAVTQRRGIRSGSSLRIVKGRRTGSAFISGQDDSSIRACAERSEKNLTENMETDELPSFSCGFDVPDSREYYDPAADDPDRHKTILQSDQIWEHHRMEGVNIAEGIYQEERVQRFIVTSNGADLRSSETLFTLSGKWFVDQPRNIMLEDHASSHFEKAVQPSWYESLSHLTQCSFAGRLSSGFYENIDLIFSPGAGRGWLSVLFHSYIDDSYETEPLGDPAPEKRRLIVSDDRTLRNAPGSTIFDGEGFPAQKVTLYRNDAKDHETIDSETVKMNGMYPAGFAERDEWLRPFPAPGNLYIQNGSMNPDSMIHPVKRGIWVYKLFGLNGDRDTKGIVFGFEGLWILDGQISAPCSGLTKAIPPGKWIANVSGIGNDLHINQRVSSPTLKFSDMTVTIY